jgi:LL-diaminopimelate aminotransferase
MRPDFNERFRSLPDYPLAGLPERRRELEAQGVDVIDLGAGDADLPPPPAALERLQEAAKDPAMSRYPYQLGLPAFREAVASWMERRFQVQFDPYSEVLPLIGSKEGIAHLPFVFLEKGDFCVIPNPGYQAYFGGVVLAGGQPHEVALRPENDFLISVETLPARVVDNLRILYLNYPNNPTAACAPAEYLRQCVDFCREVGALLVYDNAYSEMAFDGYRPPSIFQMEGASEVAIEFHSLSKTYNMTGWRLGWTVGASPLIAALSKAKSFIDTGAYKAVQAAGVAALSVYEEWVPGNVATFQRRRDSAVKALRRAGFEVPVPKATMYLWVPVPGGEPSRAFARRALEQEGVIVIPGAALGEGGEGFFRIALTVSEGRLVEAAARLSRVAA